MSSVEDVHRSLGTTSSGVVIGDGENQHSGKPETGVEIVHTPKSQAKVSYDENIVKDEIDEEEDEHDDGFDVDSRSSTRDVKLAHSETRAVFHLRLLVILVLFLAAAAVSSVVFITTRNAETREFETQYEGTSKKVTETFEKIVAEKLGGIYSLAVAMTAHGVDHKRDWPLVTLSSFQARATTALEQSGALLAGSIPLVSNGSRTEWESYSLTDEDSWIPEAIEFQKDWDLAKLGVSLPQDVDAANPGYIYRKSADGERLRDGNYETYLPVWETSPLLHGLVNFNFGNLSLQAQDILSATATGSLLIGGMETPSADGDFQDASLADMFSTILSISKGRSMEYERQPFSFVYLPVFDSFPKGRTSTGVIFAVIDWGSYFEDILPLNINGISVVLKNGCNGPYTYTINGANVVHAGQGDLHENDFSKYRKTASFEGVASMPDGSESGLPLDNNGCPVGIEVYPTVVFYDQYQTKTPLIITLSVALIFVFTAMMFFVYDGLVERRQRLIMKKAMQSTAIVSSLFPKNVRDRLMEEQQEKKGDFMAPHHRLKSYLKGGKDGEQLGLKPIADLFPHATVMFADISGFTAWSSTRDPAQVFILLQTLYQAFDELAKRRRVFKVETIGDSYVAVTGLPEPQPNHAIIMARFAQDCLVKMKMVTSDLEVSLGPDTGDLSMRFGLHSGPVTAGVLRGERSRFQLFGDTVNTAARMESTGIPDQIQASQSTADLLIEAGKGHWVRPRSDCVLAKGKGVLKTFWISVGTKIVSACETVATDASGSQSTSEMTDRTIISTVGSEKAVRQDRLVDWMVELFLEYITKILVKRSATIGLMGPPKGPALLQAKQGAALEEVVEAISLPKFDQRTAAMDDTANKITIDPIIQEQLRKFVSTIASTYRDNPFHNFEHACHVTMAVNKFLKRIVAPDLDLKEIERIKSSGDLVASHIHDYTHGINSDPMTLFAIVFSALIHDVDHRGVSNTQLAKEDEQMAAVYKNKSVAEQNSLDLSWELLMSDSFMKLRQLLFANHLELLHFRQLVVNVVLATDIFDKELNDLRKARWEKAFGTNVVPTKEEHNDLRATIVIEHIIQASDVSHTMQHWHVYRKWNSRLFKEMTLAYREGRMGADPAAFWYKGELGFFDNYIIPLAKKLEDCNVFGVSSDECLNYALNNRAEWEERGQGLIEEMMQELNPE